MREDKDIVKKFEAAISATWIYSPGAMRKAAVAITALINDTTDADEQAIIVIYANLLQRRAAEKEENFRQVFGSKIDV